MDSEFLCTEFVLTRHCLNVILLLNAFEFVRTFVSIHMLTKRLLSELMYAILSPLHVSTTIILIFRVIAFN